MELDKLKDIYNGKRIFVTGHTGFKGAWFLLMLKQFGAIVKGFSLAPENEHDLFHLIDGESLCESVINDIRNLDELKKNISSFKPDFIFHLAAQAQVIKGYDEPVVTYQTNVMGTINVLEAARSLENECHTIVITTDKVYRNNEWSFSYRENDILGGKDPYSNSKACVELIVDAYRNSFFNKDNSSLISVRAGNVFGGGDWSANRIIPDIAKSILNENTLSIRSPHSIRPWQFVLEPLYGYIVIGGYLYDNPKAMKDKHAYNIGPKTQDCVTVLSLVEKSMAHFENGKFSIHEDLTTKKKEAKFLLLDTSKIELELGIYPKIDLSQGLDWTFQWYNRYFKSPKSIGDFTRNQINEYLKMC